MVLSTVEDLVPGFTPTLLDDLLTREVKGSGEMVTILSRAVRNYQLVPGASIPLKIDGIEIAVTPEMIAAARTRARRSRKPHNDAQAVFAEVLTQLLAEAMAERIGADPLGGANLLSHADVDQLHDDLAEEPQVTALISEHFPILDPVDVLTEFLSSRDAISAAAHDYDEETQDALYRDDGDAFTASDTALIDELYTLIGIPTPTDEAEKAERQWRELVADAEDALDILASSANTDTDDEFEAEVLSAHDIIDAETLASRQRETDVRSTAERASADMTWAYGHVIVDEAQELTPMEWRMVFRRCPSKWMTLVGDTAQTSSPAGVDDWSSALEPFVGQRFVSHKLTVNYRTPEEVMEVANDVLKAIDPDAEPAVTVRSSGHPVRFLPEDTDATTVHTELDKLGGLVAVINKDNVGTVKGLEFDHVIVDKPHEIIAGSPQGRQDLYVALTRATQTLTVIGEF